SYIYRKRHTLSGAVLGLCTGVILMVIAMLGWNYLITPLYMEQSRSDVAAMLVPVFLPFNLIKGGLNAAIIALLYRPLVRGLRRAGLYPKSENTTHPVKSNRILFYVGAVVILLVCIAAIYLLR
ncbi:MAG: ECF transporter S component, partial [Oscillospiraceae bacterium]|nr:ECF transporter S component [Oscillospiraceae bacterium]